MNIIDAVGFAWDAGNIDKCQKHGVSVAILESVFSGQISFFPDLIHSTYEERFIAIGKTSDDRSILVVFTLRHRDNSVLICPISARYMHRKEIEHYEAAITQTNDR